MLAATNAADETQTFIALTPEKDSSSLVSSEAESSYFNSSDFNRVSRMEIQVLKQKRDQEKLNLTHLNVQFMSYLDKVKMLELENKSLLKELTDVRGTWGQETRHIRNMYEPQLLETRMLIDEIYIQKSSNEIQLRRNEANVTECKQAYDEACNYSQIEKNKIICLENALSENNMQLEALSRKISDAHDGIKKFKNEIQDLNKEIQTLNGELEKETLARIRLENEKQTLEEQIPFLNAIHERVMNEMQLLQSIGSQIDPNLFYSNELDRAVREIRSEFEGLSKQQKLDMEEWYNMKALEIQKQEAKREQLDSLLKMESTASITSSLDGLKKMLSDGLTEMNALKQHNASLVMRLNQLEEDFDRVKNMNTLTMNKQEDTITEIKENMADLMADYDELMNNKAVLEFEIHTYTRLLGLEETRTKEKVIHNSSPKKTSLPRKSVEREPHQNSSNGLTDLKETIESLKTLKTTETKVSPPLPPQLPPMMPVKNNVVKKVPTLTNENLTTNGQAYPVVPNTNGIKDQNIGVQNGTNSIDVIDSNLVKNIAPGVNTENLIDPPKSGKNSQVPPGEFRIITSETKCKTTFQRSAKGPISICECSPDGKVIIIENTSKNKDISLGNWEIKRRVDGNEEITYTFPEDLVIKPNKIVRIWSNNVSPNELLPSDLINSNIETWGVGEYVITIILNEMGNEKATHLQKTVFNQIGA